MDSTESTTRRRLLALRAARPGGASVAGGAHPTLDDRGTPPPGLAAGSVAAVPFGSARADRGEFDGTGRGTGAWPGRSRARWRLGLRSAVAAACLVAILTVVVAVVVVPTRSAPVVAVDAAAAVGDGRDEASAAVGGAGVGEVGVSGEPEAGGEAVGGGDAGSAPAGEASEGTGRHDGAAELVVHVVGAVGEPGVVRLPAGSRVVDAVEAAGGVQDEADLGAVNLARQLTDGEQVWVPRPGEDPPAGWVSPSQAAQAAPSGGAEEEAQQSAVDLNAADQAELERLPGIGPVLAGRILAWRADHGAFTSVDELAEVTGIGPALLARLRPVVTV